MKWARKNHPCKRILIRRDEIYREESSLQENFYPQRWNLQGRIIPARDFLSAGMKSARKNHPWKWILIRRDEIYREESSLREIFIRRDEMSEEESSLREIFYPQGWNLPGRIILAREFLSAGMKSASPRGPHSRNAFSELPSGGILNPTTFKIDPFFSEIISSQKPHRFSSFVFSPRMR